jgi:uncharacterized peroxidase-related enzyme
MATNTVPFVDENAAAGEVAELYNSMQEAMQIPFVPNLHKAIANSPHALAGTWGALQNIMMRTSLPQSLASMILYSIAAQNQCQYCSAAHGLTCRTLGIDDDTLKALADDISVLSPHRVQGIIQFALKCSADRANLTDEDFDAVRAQGIGDEELVDIIALVALGNYLDIMADSLRVMVDEPIRQALEG